MARVLPSDVKAIMDTGLSDVSLTAHIDAASLVIDETLVEDGVAIHSDARMTAIEQYLAAHFAASQDPTTESESLGDARLKYEGAVGEGLAETRYGRRALDLDTSGELREAGDAPAEFETFGTTYDYTNPDA